MKIYWKISWGLKTWRKLHQIYNIDINIILLLAFACHLLFSKQHLPGMLRVSCRTAHKVSIRLESQNKCANFIILVSWMEFWRFLKTQEIREKVVKDSKTFSEAFESNPILHNNIWSYFQFDFLLSCLISFSVFWI